MPVREQFDSDAAFEKALRDYFAAKAMQGLLANGEVVIEKATEEGVLRMHGRVGIPKLAYEYADAMLPERDKPS